jgi:hypothetical protein
VAKRGFPHHHFRLARLVSQPAGDAHRRNPQAGEDPVPKACVSGQSDNSQSAAGTQEAHGLRQGRLQVHVMQRCHQADQVERLRLEVESQELAQDQADVSRVPKTRWQASMAAWSLSTPVTERQRGKEGPAESRRRSQRPGRRRPRPARPSRSTGDRPNCGSSWRSSAHCSPSRSAEGTCRRARPQRTETRRGAARAGTAMRAAGWSISAPRGRASAGATRRDVEACRGAKEFAGQPVPGEGGRTASAAGQNRRPVARRSATVRRTESPPPSRGRGGIVAADRHRGGPDAGDGTGVGGWKTVSEVPGILVGCLFQNPP